MNRTRIVFFVIVGLALAIVAAWLILSWVGSSGSGQEPTAVPGQSGGETLEVQIVTALPVADWVQEAANQFNAEKRTLEGQLIHVTITPMDGLTAKGRYDRDEMNPLPTAWIPESRYLVELVNAAQNERLGRDVFLTDGEYRAKPLAISLLAWGVYDSRANVLESKYGALSWQAIHDAAMAPGGWAELGGQGDWGYFKLAISNPRKNVSGLAAMVAAAGEYFKKTNITVDDVTNTRFQAWLGEIMSSMSDLSGGSYTVNDLALFGYTTGDAGQLLESDLLVNMQGIQTRWADPLRIAYPEYVTWFDFPFSVWMGSETTALEKNAALEFEEYLLTEEIQKGALAYGLRPANPNVLVTGDGSLFDQWAGQGVLGIVPRTTAMRSPDRDVLQALLRWFDLNVAGR
ncbi:MAG: substrate-binding domain-containing protein [Anaerolineae bacterium]|nr:substrate-binding domain-containing protein [Anaerolineae bacterium]